MEAKIQNKINEWLSGNYDEATKNEILVYKKKIQRNLKMHFTKILNLVPVV